MRASSDVSFTIGHGILNEVFYPWEDEASIKDMGLLVTGPDGFFSEEKTDTEHVIKMASPGVPAFTIVNTCRQGTFRIHKELISDPIRNTVLQRTRFRALKGKAADYRLYVLVAPHLAGQGAGNTAWVDQYKGVPMLFAENKGRALALACSMPWLKRSVGFVGVSDGWQDIRRHGSMRWQYTSAPKGNVALCAEIDLARTGGRFVIALGFGHNGWEAAYSARGSLLAGYGEIREAYVKEWRNWQKKLSFSVSGSSSAGKLFRTSAAVLRMHEANRVPGAIIASMSIPWGETKGDDDTGGYHMVWPRDLVESSGGFLALHAREDMLRILTYLMTTQEEDGHWVQNMWLQGKPHWNGVQMDQTALPILLIDLFRRYGTIQQGKIGRYWLTVKQALSFIVTHGPYTEQDRWERDGGLSIFTVATEIAALLAGADFADENGESDVARYCRQTADCWNTHLEQWFYVTGSPLALQCGVKGHYIRLNHEGMPAMAMKDTQIEVHNRPPETCRLAAWDMVSPDALALVRFGLRAASDPRIRDTITVIDRTLKVQTPYGPSWRRYTMDGYGEHDDGTPYDGCGVGRAWPLLTGERAHYEIAAGNLEEAARLVHTMEDFSSNGLFPEQIWDGEPIPEKGLMPGKHSGSAMPLVWAHAEYIKLIRSLKAKKVFDMPAHGQDRYIDKNTGSVTEIWRQDHPLEHIDHDRMLRIEVPRCFSLHWSADGWLHTRDTPAQDSGLGVYYVDLSLDEYPGQTLVFTFYDQKLDRWEGKDFKIGIL